MEYKVSIVDEPGEIETEINRWAAEGMSLHSLHQVRLFGGREAWAEGRELAGGEWIIVMVRDA